MVKTNGEGTLAVAIIGAGFMGQTHASAYAEMSNVRIAGIADNDSAKSSQLAKKHNTAVYGSFDNVLDDESIDIVDINVPPVFHREYVLKAVQAGKHVICEKPIALTHDDADAIVEATENAGVKFMVAHILRFVPEYAALKRLIANNELGRPLSATAYRIDAMPAWGQWFSNASQSGGAAINIHIHDVDLLNWLFGKPKTIYSSGVLSADGGCNHILSSIAYDNDVKVFAEASFLMPKDYPFSSYMRALCEKGTAEIQLRLQNGKRTGGLTVYKPGMPPIKPQLRKTGPFFNELRYFTDCVQNDSQIEICTARDARLALSVCLAARESVQSNKTVIL